MIEPVRVRKATPDDLPTLALLGEALGRQHAGYDPTRFHVPPPAEYEDFFRDQLDEPAATVLVAELGGAVVAYVFARVEPPSFEELLGRSGWVHDLYVAKEARGIGAGSRLLDAAVDALRSAGVDKVMLAVSPQNAEGAALFRRRGFRVTMHEMTLDVEQPGG